MNEYLGSVLCYMYVCGAGRGGEGNEVVCMWCGCQAKPGNDELRNKTDGMIGNSIVRRIKYEMYIVGKYMG